MVLKTYIFAQNGGTYQQYTSDHSDTFLRFVCNSCKVENQIVIRRDGNLIYYAYAHKVSTTEIYGFCIVCGEVCLNIQSLYDFFKQCFEDIAKKGLVFRFDDKGVIHKRIDNYASEPAEIDNVFRYIKHYLDQNESFWEPLPPEDLSIPMNSRIILSFEEDERSKIIDAIRHYHNIYLTLENSIPSSFSKTVARLNLDNNKLRTANISLKSELSNLRNKQRNIIWVSILGIIAIFFGVVIWNKVLFPSEVTRYQTKEFIYYGPLKDKQPHGEGVAFYPDDDEYDRRYYIGHFMDGVRQDTSAMLFYQNGDYFYGTIEGDNLVKGTFYLNSNHSHFEGTFEDDKPYDGMWYNHEKSYKLKNGQIRYL